MRRRRGQGASFVIGAERIVDGDELDRGSPEASREPVVDDDRVAPPSAPEPAIYVPDPSAEAFAGVEDSRGGELALAPEKSRRPRFPLAPRTAALGALAATAVFVAVVSSSPDDGGEPASNLREVAAVGKRAAPARESERAQRAHNEAPSHAQRDQHAPRPTPAKRPQPEPRENRPEPAEPSAELVSEVPAESPVPVSEPPAPAPAPVAAAPAPAPQPSSSPPPADPVPAEEASSSDFSFGAGRAAP
jgi:hypothetical protein